MDCSTARYKTFLISCNVVLLFVGVSVFGLGMKMEQLLSVLLLINVPLIGQAVKAVIAAGVFISLVGMTGIAGACNETGWLIFLHLVALGIIVIMEFGIGVTLLVVRRTVEIYIDSTECNMNCAATLDSLVLDYALPSAGLMLTIIIVEALMIYSALKMLAYVRDCPKIIIEPSDADVVVHEVQMQNVASPIQTSFTSPHSNRTFIVTPESRYQASRMNPSPLGSFPVSPNPWYTPQMDYMRHQVRPGFLQQFSSPQCTAPQASPEPPQASPEPPQASPAPPHFTSLPPQHQLPPSYAQVVPKQSNFIATAPLSIP